MAINSLHHDFENEVRRIARAKWPSAQYSGARILDGRERDGIFETDDAVHFIEATVSTSADKAKEDTKKIFRAIFDHNRGGNLKAAIGWFITKNEPTADQRQEVLETGKGQVKAVSFAQFQQSLVDVRAYLAARRNHGFGSVKDFISPDTAPAVPYVDIGLSDKNGEQTFLVNNLIDALLVGKHFAITGQYGAGKSMTLRELFMRLAEKYVTGKTHKFPIYINLREHSGQRDPVEILERHARSIGFDSPSSLIRAWRAGFVILLADGFDEITSLGVQGSWKKLKDLRMRSLEGVRKLIRESANTGVVVTGRSHYFESEKELNNALGLKEPSLLAVDEFTEQQMKHFLSRFPEGQVSNKFPSWLPTRPLLLGYLASRKLLSDITGQESFPDAVDGWDYLLNRIYEREAEIETNLDGVTLRRILERAATVARTTEDGLGPIARSDLFTVFKEVCGYEPDEQGVLAIQRLPGLGIYRAEDESRCFVDSELADVCKGHELIKFLQSPYDTVKDSVWVESMNFCDKPISSIACELVIRKTKDSDLRGLIRQAIGLLNSRTDLICSRGDIAALLLHGQIELDISLSVSEINFNSCDVEFDENSKDLRMLKFSHCLFDNLGLHAGMRTENLPYFDHCIIEQISGRVSKSDLPRERFLETCEFSSFDDTLTGAAIRATKLSVGEKVLLVTLRKLFVQSLSGRAESAIYRGLDVDERRYVHDVLKLLKRNGLAIEYSRGDGIVWIPVRKTLERVRMILRAPAESDEKVVIEARALA
jgi:AraC-like DNA-binding protein